MPDGKLNLRVVDVYGTPIAERVDVLLKNQTLTETLAYRDLDVTTARTITELNVFPNGTYRIEVDSPSFHPVSRFVNIPPNGNGDVVITLPVNPRKVIRVQFPQFGAPGIPSEAWRLLERSPNVINGRGMTGKALYDSLEATQRAGFLNLVAKADRTRLTSQHDERPSVLSFIQELTELRGDRFFALVPVELRSATIVSMAQQIFHEVDESLHVPPAGFGHDRSFKTLDPFGNLQLSFFSSASGKFALDMDIDDAQGFDHLFQVVGNLFGGKTHPYNIHEILIASQELDPGYQLILHEAQAGGRSA